MTRIGIANIVTAFGFNTIGTKVSDFDAFVLEAKKAIDSHDPTNDREPGQHYIMCPALIPLVSAGVGQRTDNPEDYIIRKGRFGVDRYLRRDRAATVEGCALVVYTRAAYLADPDINKPEEAEERKHVEESDYTHIIVAVLAFAGPRSPLPPETFIHNLAGGNNEVAQWTKEEICAKAAEIESYWNTWCIVAD